MCYKTMLFVAVLVFSACTNVMDKPLNEADLAAVKEQIRDIEGYSDMKKNYIIDELELTMDLVLAASAFTDLRPGGIPTFGEQIAEFSAEFDEKNEEVLAAMATNEQLAEFIMLTGARSFSFGRNSGQLFLEFNFNNPFDKDILYVVLNYHYTDRYDREYFNEHMQLTDEIASDFREPVSVSLSANYSVADFLYSTVPSRASDVLAEELGRDEADEKANRDFLMAGLHVEAERIVFADRSEISYEPVYWEYLDSE